MSGLSFLKGTIVALHGTASRLQCWGNEKLVWTCRWIVIAATASDTLGAIGPCQERNTKPKQGPQICDLVSDKQLHEWQTDQALNEKTRDSEQFVR